MATGHFSDVCKKEDLWNTWSNAIFNAPCQPGTVDLNLGVKESTCVGQSRDRQGLVVHQITPSVYIIYISVYKNLAKSPILTIKNKHQPYQININIFAIRYTLVPVFLLNIVNVTSIFFYVQSNLVSFAFWLNL
jgi:hypothetical protein